MMNLDVVLDWLRLLPLGAESAVNRKSTGTPSPTRLDPDALVGLGIAPFSDDLELLPGVRVPIRACLFDRDFGGYLVDFTETDPLPPGAGRLEVTRRHVVSATTLAFARALDLDDPTDVLPFLDITIPEASWLDAKEIREPAGACFAVARIFDVISGALSRGWPARVGAGSCSLGALVAFEGSKTSFVDIVAGGEGATSTRAGQSAWPSPIFQPREQVDPPGWLSIHTHPRVASGGVGLRAGGDGIVREYVPSRDVEVVVAIDRINNPPHGLERAGPPRGSEVYVLAENGAKRSAPPWETVQLEAGDKLVVETCGGAGHGFPGYGEIDYEP